MRSIAVLTSGGDAPGMNAVLRTIVKLCAKQGIIVFGVEEGYKGLIEGKIRRLEPRDVDTIVSWGGTILGSARSEAFRTKEGRAKAARTIRDFDGLIVIGGNGSLRGAQILAEEQGVKVIGVPASIDNDIGCTSLAIGVDTALNTIVEACDKISDTARAHRRVFVVEVMGRYCGYLAMAASISAAADACLYRERGKSDEQLIAEIEQLVRRSFALTRGKERVLVLKAEGVQLSTHQLAERLQSFVDEEVPGVTVRATVLGHLVRGGNPTFRDRFVAGRLGLAAVERLAGGHSGEMVAWRPYHTSEAAPTMDPAVWAFPLEKVHQETEALLEGSSAVTRRRVRMMEASAGILAL